MNTSTTTNPDYVFDGTDDNFQQLVLNNSYKGLVLVNYWTAKAGPCLKLWQTLEPLVAEYQGRFLLVNINTDTQQALARSNGITSVPTIKVYSKGTVVDAIHGAHSESSLRAMIDKYLPPAKNSALALAISAYQANQIEDALKILNDAIKKSPGDLDLYKTLLKILFRQKRYADIEDYIDQRDDEFRDLPEISTIRIHARLMHLAELAPDATELDDAIAREPDNIDYRLSRAALATVVSDYENALEMLLSALRLDRHHQDAFARRAMIVIFSLLGDGHELTKVYRDRMRECLELP